MSKQFMEDAHGRQVPVSMIKKFDLNWNNGQPKPVKKKSEKRFIFSAFPKNKPVIRQGRYL